MHFSNCRRTLGCVPQDPFRPCPFALQSGIEYSFVSKLLFGTKLKHRNPLLERTLAEFRELVDTVIKRYRSAEQRSPVGTAALRVLTEIVRHPGIHPSAIATRLRLHRSTASNLLRELQRHRLIERRLADADRRCTEVHPSNAGVALLERAGIGLEGPLEFSLGSLSKGQLAALGRSVQPLLQALRDNGTTQTGKGEQHG